MIAPTRKALPMIEMGNAMKMNSGFLIGSEQTIRPVGQERTMKRAKAAASSPLALGPWATTGIRNVIATAIRPATRMLDRITFAVRSISLLSDANAAVEARGSVSARTLVASDGLLGKSCLRFRPTTSYIATPTRAAESGALPISNSDFLRARQRAPLFPSPTLLHFMSDNVSSLYEHFRAWRK